MKKKITDKKVCIITGGSSGIGKACVEKFLNEGFIVVDASRTKKGKVIDPNYFYFKTDVAKESDIKKLFSFVEKSFGKIDTLINNAGFARFANLADSKTKDFDDMFAVNVRGLYLCTRYALKTMLKRQQGDIVNVSSIGGKNGFASASIYTATKHAVMGFAASLLLEVRKDNIRIITVCPGSVDTNFFTSPGKKKSPSSNVILEAEDIADMVVAAVKLPSRAMVTEIEVRPSNPVKK
ncbi:SDR family oxidoreductase [soil metagenome]